MVDAIGVYWDLEPPANPYFEDLTVEEDTVLYVPSGTVIRCTGTFTNNGTIVVRTGAMGGGHGPDELDGVPAIQAPGTGWARGPAGWGEIGDATEIRWGGHGGTGLGEGQDVYLLHPGPFGGGGGTGAEGSGGSWGAAGGGSLVVLAQGGIVNSDTGAIRARGDDRTRSSEGGGGGGIVILASPTSITQAGTIDVTGGDGGWSSRYAGAGGGGGGGIVHLLSPIVDDTGTADVSGGAAGRSGDPGSVTEEPRQGGGGGGACAGDGGDGGNVNTSGDPGNGEPGDGGVYLISEIDPTYLF